MSQKSKNIKKILVTVLIGFFFTGFAQKSASQFEYKESSNLLAIGKGAEYFNDESASLGIDEILNSKEFKASETDVLNFKSSTSNYWIKFSLKNESKLELLLELAYPIMDLAELYVVQDGVPTLLSRIDEEQSFYERDYLYRNLFFNLPIAQNESKVFYLKINSGEQILVPLKIGSEELFFPKNRKTDLINGLYFGIMLVMFLYNLFVYFSVRDKVYLYYVVYIFCVALTQASLHGYVLMYITPDFPWLSERSVYFFGATVGISVFVFAKEFLRPDIHFPKLSKVFYVFIGMYLVALGLMFFGNYSLSYQGIDITAGTGSFFVLFVAAKSVLKKVHSAKFFLAGWTIFLGSVIVFVLRNANVIEFSDFSNYALQLGSAIEALLLSFALADKINIYKAERLEAIEEKEQLLREQNVVLETQVNERTLELSEKNEELNTTLANLKSTQSQLVQSEKMASLGQLTAGIAHEINNSMNYATQRVQILKRDFVDLTQILEKYEEVYSETEAYKSIVEVMNDLDYDILQEEIPESIDDIEDGINRAIDIAKGLKDFSRLDEVVFKKDSINDGITATLKMLKSKLTDIDVSTSLSEFPDIVCNIGKLNQVFMNVIDNAVDALNDVSIKEAKLEVNTNLNADLVHIIIKDNGPGMPKEVIQKLFDPFFTTKEIGEGTGLGMSISLGVINEHKGTINVNSEVGVGTEIIISIPVK